MSEGERIVEINNTERLALIEWLQRPSGSHGNNPRVHFDAVEGGGVMIRTQPYRAAREMREPDKDEFVGAVLEAARRAGATYPTVAHNSSGWPTIVDTDDGAVYEVVCRQMNADLVPDAVDTYPQQQALAEGWCIIDANGSYLEIQRDDDFEGRQEDGYWFDGFPTDGLARAFVMEKADEGSAYHRMALAYVSAENIRRYQDSEDTPDLAHERPNTWAFMWLREWRHGSMVGKTVEKVRLHFDPATFPSQDAVPCLIRNHEDIVPLEESDAVPDVTFGNSAFTFAEQEVIYGDVPDHAGETAPTSARECAQCVAYYDTEAIIEGKITNQNMKTVLIDGHRREIERCPGCGALNHQPK